MSTRSEARAEVLCPISGQTPREELFNALSHGVGLLACMGGTAVLVVLAALWGTAWQIVGVAIFGGALVVLYGASTLYHVSWSLRWKRALRVVDHAAIFLLIAGSYTPFVLGPLRGWWGWSLFGVIWGMAGLGIVFKVFVGSRAPLLSTAAYVTMGWLAIIAFGPLSAALDTTALALLIAGGVAYTLGALFYLWDERVPYFHLVFHLLVLTGSACHVLAVVAYLWQLPAPPA